MSACGCRILPDPQGEQSVGRGAHRLTLTIAYCPTHDAAPVLATFVRELAELPCAGLNWHVPERCTACRARALLATLPAGGEETQ